MPRFARLFSPLALTTALLTLGLIVFGAVVRVTDSGLGCGNHWPLCNGTIFPPLNNLNAWIEWLHRLFAVLIGAFGLGMLGVALNAYRQRRKNVLYATVTAALLFFVQSMLGAVVVVLELPPTFVTLHLGTAMLLLGALLVSGIFASYRAPQPYQADAVSTLIYLNTGLSLLIILTGALVRGAGATLACVDWPLCNGQLFPFNQGQLQIVHMTHRVAVLALGVTLALLLWNVWRQRQGALLRRLALGALLLYLAQAGVGALFVLTTAAPLWGAAHVGLAATTWALLVVLSVIEAINTRVVVVEESAWQVQSETISN
ncbi:MAG: heme A synthase [Chloroflexi bacterium]|nr:heme A synthase [Chloroflexota bacterium]